MAQSISNTVTPQKGLVSLNPFANPGSSNTQITSTPSTAIFSPKPSTPVTAPSYGILGTPGSQNVNTSATIGSSNTPLSSNVSGLITPNYSTAPTTSATSSPTPSTSLFATPGETFAQYEARVGGQNAVSTTGSSTGSIPPPQTSAPQPQTGLVDLNANPYTAQAPTFPGLVGSLSTTAATSSPQYQAAQNQYLSANQQLEQLKTQAAQQNANIGGSRTNLAEAGGEQGLLQNLTANSEAALTGEMSAAQAAAQAATGQQATQQSGLAGAAGLSAPQGANSLGTFNPTTGQYNSYGGGTGGGASEAGAVQTQIQQGSQVQTMVGQQSQAQALAQNLSSLIESAGINPNNTSVFTGFMNGVNQWLNTQSGDPQYQNFANLLNEISSRYASILNQSGGTPTDQSTISHSIINGLASGQSIQQVLGSLDKNATDSINALKGAAGNNAISGNSNNSISAGGYNYTKNAQGQWVVSQ